MNSIAAPVSSCSSASRSRMPARTERSSELVGSSSTISAGFGRDGARDADALQLAARQLARDSGRASPPAGARAGRAASPRRAARRATSFVCSISGSSIRSPRGHARVERGPRVLEDHLHVARAAARQRGFRQRVVMSWPVEGDAALGRREQPQHAAAEVDLPDPDLADQARASRRRRASKRHVVHRVRPRRRPARRSASTRSLDVQHGASCRPPARSGSARHGPRPAPTSGGGAAAGGARRAGSGRGRGSPAAARRDWAATPPKPRRAPSSQPLRRRGDQRAGCRDARGRAKTCATGPASTTLAGEHHRRPRRSNARPRRGRG